MRYAGCAKITGDNLVFFVDPLFHPSLVVPAEKKTVNGKEYEAAVFDIVLEAEKQKMNKKDKL